MNEELVNQEIEQKPIQLNRRQRRALLNKKSPGNNRKMTKGRRKIWQFQVVGHPLKPSIELVEKTDGERKAYKSIVVHRPGRVKFLKNKQPIFN